MRLTDIHPDQTLVLNRRGEWSPRARLPAEEHLVQVQVLAVQTPEEAEKLIERHVIVQLPDTNTSMVTCRQLIGTPQEYALLKQVHAREQVQWEEERDAMLASVRHPGYGAVLQARGKWYPGAAPARAQLILEPRDRIAGALMLLGLDASAATASKAELLHAAQRMKLPVRGRRQRGNVTSVIIDGIDAIRTVIGTRYS